MRDAADLPKWGSYAQRWVAMTEIYGVDVIDFDTLRHPFSDLANMPDDWRAVFSGSLDLSDGFLPRMTL